MIRIVSTLCLIIKQFADIDVARADCNVEHILPFLEQFSHLIFCSLNTCTGVGQRDRRYLGDTAPSFFLQALLKQLLCHLGISCQVSIAIWAFEVWAIAGHALWNNMVSGDQRALPDLVHNLLLIDG